MQVKDELVQVSQAPVNESYGRLDYHEECEEGVNEQIKSAVHTLPAFLAH